MEFSREMLNRLARPRFGDANPEKITNEFWEWMIRGDEGTLAESPDSSEPLGRIHLKATEGPRGPYPIRKFLSAPNACGDGPYWTFDRMGASRTELPDGRTVCIAGEHEDSYDPDFCIYNDVVVLQEGRIEIYGYPREVFTPTDFHTATRVGDRLLIIGSTGYTEDRFVGRTPVYALDLNTYRISALQPSGEAPGWISMHEASAGPDGVITIQGGRVFELRGGAQFFRRNIEEYALDTNSLIWTRATNRNWRQFQIRDERKSFLAYEQIRGLLSRLPTCIESILLPAREWNEVLLNIKGVPVSIIVQVSWVDILVEGPLSEDAAMRVAEQVRAATEEAIGRKCVLELL